MNHTYFYIKLQKDPFNLNGKTREFQKNIKLQYPIRGAKFLKIYNLFSKKRILLIKCDLIDQKYSFTNIKDSKDYVNNVFESDIVLVGYGTETDDLIKINKSLINEFNLSIKNLDEDIYDKVEVSEAFIKIKIYHES